MLLLQTCHLPLNTNSVETCTGTAEPCILLSCILTITCTGFCLLSKLETTGSGVPCSSMTTGQYATTTVCMEYIGLAVALIYVIRWALLLKMAILNWAQFDIR